MAFTLIPSGLNIYCDSGFCIGELHYEGSDQKIVSDGLDSGGSEEMMRDSSKAILAAVRRMKKHQKFLIEQGTV